MVNFSAMFAVVLATVFLAFVSATPKCPSNQDDVVLVPNPDDCASYYACDGGVAYLMNCSAGLLFNPELRVCDWAENVTCSVTPSPSTAPNEVLVENSNEESSEEFRKKPSEEPIEEPSKEPSDESSEESDEFIKIPNAEPCEPSSESSESSEASESSQGSGELPIYK